MTILRNTNTVDKVRIINSFVPFHYPETIRGMMIGNDLDSILAAFLLKDKFGWDIFAIYDYTTLWYSNNELNFLENFLQGRLRNRY